MSATPGQPGPVMLDLLGPTLAAEESELLRHPLVGGVILFARHYESPAQLRELIAAIRRLRPELLLAVDQEGGRVQRFKQGFTSLPPMQAFLTDYRHGADRTLTLVEDAGWLMAAEILAAGLDFSFAPVLDVDEHFSSVIADRSFSPRPDEVVALAGRFIRGMHRAGMKATGKHFPGHGGVEADSHLALPEDNRSWAALEQRDWVPFARLAGQLDAMMPAHIVFPAVDHRPVGFSPVWLRDKLRGELGFEGVIFSDDLDMAGAAVGGDFGQRAELALNAGCDMVLVCNNRPGACAVLEHLSASDLTPSPRLAGMRPTRTWEWEALRGDNRWRETRAQLQRLTQSAADNPSAKN